MFEVTDMRDGSTKTVYAVDNTYRTMTWFLLYDGGQQKWTWADSKWFRPSMENSMEDREPQPERNGRDKNLTTGPQEALMVSAGYQAYLTEWMGGSAHGIPDAIRQYKRYLAEILDSGTIPPEDGPHIPSLWDYITAHGIDGRIPYGEKEFRARMGQDGAYLTELITDVILTRKAGQDDGTDG